MTDPQQLQQSQQSQSLPAPPPERVLAVTAHPDDVDFGMAGTLAALSDAGSSVVYCVATDGDAGGFDRDVPREEIAGIRRDEQRAAGRLVGASEVLFLGHPDGALVASLELRKAIARQIRRFRPDLVLTQSPERNYDRIPASHPDHLALGEAALCAVYPDARNPFAFTELLEEEGLEPHRVPEVWIAGFPQPDHAVDVTDTMDRKLAAILAHKSQLPDPASVEHFVREWTTATAERFGLGPGRHAEAFKRVHVP